MLGQKLNQLENYIFPFINRINHACVWVYICAFMHMCMHVYVHACVCAYVWINKKTSTAVVAQTYGTCMEIGSGVREMDGVRAEDGGVRQ